MKSPGRAHIRYSPYTRFHCTFYCFPPRMIQIEKFFGQQSFMWRDNKQFQNYIHTKFIFAYMLIKRPECWYIRIWFLINKEDLNLNQIFFKFKSLNNLWPYLNSNHSDSKCDEDEHTNKKSYVILRKWRLWD